jgi:hypothetical protein
LVDQDGAPVTPYQYGTWVFEYINGANSQSGLPKDDGCFILKICCQVHGG